MRIKNFKDYSDPIKIKYFNEQIYRTKTIMGINKTTRKFNEVLDNTYDMINSIYSDARIVMSKDDMIKFRPTPIENQEPRPKPCGLWYGIGPSWIDWVRSEMPDWEVDNVFKIDIDESKMLLIRNIEELAAFDKEYGDDYSPWKNINWHKVASKYGGIEIAPYVGRHKYFWYLGWDVASGCIWDDGVIMNIEKISN
jgi:hypothetical protein